MGSPTLRTVGVRSSSVRSVPPFPEGLESEGKRRKSKKTFSPGLVEVGHLNGGTYLPSRRKIRLGDLVSGEGTEFVRGDTEPR